MYSLLRTHWLKAEAVLSTMCILFLCREEVSGSTVSVCRRELEKGITRHQVA